MTDREKLIKLLCEANSKSVDAELFEDSSYAQQLEIEADFLIANGATFATDNNVGHWIPVTERLPENDLEDVLAFDGISCCLISFTRTDIYGKKYFVIGRNDITHWMPLPEPPKEGE